MWSVLLPVLATSVVSVAHAEPEITSAEFRNTAQTLEKGEFVIHPLFMPSSYGITDKIQLNIGVLATALTGPANIGVEVQVVDSGDLAVSVAPEFNSNWGFNSISGGAEVHATQTRGKSRLNGSAGVYVHHTSVDGASATSVGVPLSLGYDRITSPNTTWRATVDFDPDDLLNGGDVFDVGVAGNWNHAFTDRFRLGLGIAAYLGNDPAVIAEIEDLGINLPDLAVLPVPTVELWWKI